MALLTKTPMLRLIALPVAKTIRTRAVGDGRVRICETCSLEIAALIAEQRAIGSWPIDGPGQDEEFGGRREAEGARRNDLRRAQWAFPHTTATHRRKLLMPAELQRNEC